MTLEYRIRPAHLADAPTLARLYRAAYAINVELGFPSYAATATRADLEAWIRETRLYVAVRNGKLMGSVRYRPQGIHSDDGAPEFGRLAVPPRARGNGIGSTLLEHVEAIAHRDGNDLMRLRTFEGHPFLPELYRRRGYREVRVTPLESRPFDVLHMKKSL